MRTAYALMLATLLVVGSNINLPAQVKTASKDIYHDGWTDFNKNGRKDVYEDSKANTNARVEDLLAQMNLDEKTCQTATLYGYARVLKDELPTPEWKKRVWKDGIANIDEHLNENMGALDVELTPAEVQQISTESAALRVYGERMDAGNMALME